MNTINSNVLPKENPIAARRRATQVTVLIDAETFRRLVNGPELTFYGNSGEWRYRVLRLGAFPGTRGTGRSEPGKVWLAGGVEVVAGKVYGYAGKLEATHDLKLKISGVPRKVAERLQLPIED
jgi:hypothetical protein